MSTFKYVCAVFLRINDLDEDDRTAMGWVLVVVDVVVMLVSVVAFVLVVVLLRAIGAGAMHGNEEVAHGGEGNEAASLARIVPTRHEADHQVHTARLRNEIAALQWQKNIRQTLMNNSTPSTTSSGHRRVKRKQTWRTQIVEEIQHTHQNHRDLALKNIELQQRERRSSLQARVQARLQARLQQAN